MKRLTLKDVLKPYGVEIPRDLQKIYPCHYDHAKKVLEGVRPISRKLAVKLKEHSGGALSLDLLFSLGKSRKKQ